MRYFILSYVLVFRDISERIRRRFPTYSHLVPALMTEAEKARIENEDIKRAYWMPIEWSMQLLKRCYSRGQIDEHHFAILCQTITKYREMAHNLLSFDWVNVPLVYTQVVHICTLAYFGIICFASQPIREEGVKMWISDFVIPGYAIYEFIFFVGWLKVMLNPFGMDEDDFEIDWLVERNLQIGYSYVDAMYDKLPPLVYVGVTTLPHTKASMALIPKATPMVGSVANVKVPRAEQQVISKEDVELIRKLVGPKFGRRFADYVARNKPSEGISDEKLTVEHHVTPTIEQHSAPRDIESPKDTHAPPTSATPMMKPLMKSQPPPKTLKSSKSTNASPETSSHPPIRHHVKMQKTEGIDQTQSSSDFTKLNPTPEPSRMWTKLDRRTLKCHKEEDLLYLPFKETS
ncbi:hypothetical protein Y032_0787g2345 [Ancylostoma ceylanicum]|uniref:Bestrophin homolog n=1 Tax=Ancylostoma ceylanicum TaxID=53326 RepID=A0A016WCX4_9BILA|nr:hypothetical protein Y032_0787g2345 [Ancylostoma ceylanicum]